jgi:hypothetical protein
MNIVAHTGINTAESPKSVRNCMVYTPCGRIDCSDVHGLLAAQTLRSARDRIRAINPTPERWQYKERRHGANAASPAAKGGDRGVVSPTDASFAKLPRDAPYEEGILVSFTVTTYN